MVVQKADEELLKQLSEASETIQAGRAFSRYPDFVREAYVALHQHGDYKIAVVLGAIAAEIFLDDLLMHLLWEERRRPEEAAPIFEQGLVARVRKHFSSRLGGQWVFDRSGPVQAWHRDLAGLRHRVVHAGHEPSKPEAEAALVALSNLEAFVLNRITQRPQLVNYARTAVVLLGKRGLAQRGKLSDEIKKLMNDPNEPPWGDTFRRWRDVVAQCRADPVDRIEPQVARAVSVAVISSDGAIGWWLHDREANLVCPAKVPSLPESQQTALNRITEEIKTRASQPISAAIADAEIQPAEPVAWMFAYRVLPMAGAMVDGSDLGSIQL